MSHFCTLAIIPRDTIDVEGAVAKLLAPYDENIGVGEYKKECWCKGRVARNVGYETAEQEAPSTIEQYRKAYWAIEGEKPDWEEWTKDWREIAERAEKEHPLFEKFDPECEDCGGSGIRSTTYNPKSKWDWWQIGGRWTGSLDEYEPEKDLENQEWCSFCAGTGNRSDATYYAHPDKVEATRYAVSQKSALVGALGELGEVAEPIEIMPGYVQVEWCNGCDGKGIKAKWPTEWVKYEGDVQPVERVLEKGFIPFALVSDDGWAEKGDMGWFGIVSNEKDGGEWEQEAKGVLERYKGMLAVVVDCHI